MTYIHLSSNSEPLALTVNLNGYGLRTLQFERDEVWYDDRGWVRMISRSYDEGTVGNFKLVPRHEQVWKITEALAEAAASIGLSFLAGKLVAKVNTWSGGSKTQSVSHVGNYLADRVTPSVRAKIRDLFTDAELSDAAYYALDNGELVYTQAIRLRLR